MVSEPLALGLLVAAMLFAVVNGVNDGGAVVAVGLRVPTFRPWTAILISVAGIGLLPVLFGTDVATTLAVRLVSFSGVEGQVAIAAALVSAALVVTSLTRRGFPTSLTLALVGGIAGAGVGLRLPVAWAVIGTVLAIAALAPFLGAGLAFTWTRMVRYAPSSDYSIRRIRRLHLLAFLLVCGAYGANDGQKMLAVFAIAAGGTSTVTPRLDHLLAICALFAVGAALGVRRLGVRFGSGVLPTRPTNAVIAEFSSAAAVFGSAYVGAPVSMTQAIAGSLVGTGASDGIRRVRWRLASGIAIAWALTLPLALVTAIVLARIGRELL